MEATSIAQQIEQACHLVTQGRCAMRALAELVSQFPVKESEFRLLWALRRAGSALDQTQLSEQLGCSTAQVSALVEQLHNQGLIRRECAPNDRRRSLCTLSEQGQQLLEKIEALAAGQFPICKHLNRPGGLAA